MKDRRTLLYLLVLSTFFLSMMALLASAETNVSTSAKSSALYNPNTRSFIYQKNADINLPMASTTKIMTGLIAIETLDLNEIITIPNEATGIEGSSIYLKEGDRVTAKDLIYSLLLQSANDAATALAIRISGSNAKFAEKMNGRALEIGATNTSFENPHGLDSDKHYTTAHDLSLIAAEALTNDTFKKIVSTYKYSFRIGDETRTIVNHNKLLKNYLGCNGVKTGYTKKSGRCLVTSAERDGITLIAVTLNATDDWSDHKKLLDLGFENLESVNLNDVIQIPEEIPTVSIDGKKLNVHLATDTIIKFKEDNIEYYLDLPYYIVKDVTEGEKIGEVILKTGNREEKIDIVATTDLKIKKFAKRFL